ncbi:MAG: hypothetical protein MOGMAGMI_02052 [Candidatus Omnitrophica bacterium]|nr:hypothetical protein [Candidatus Omnitrophota bacterium]
MHRLRVRLHVAGVDDGDPGLDQGPDIVVGERPLAAGLLVHQTAVVTEHHARRVDVGDLGVERKQAGIGLEARLGLGLDVDDLLGRRTLGIRAGMQRLEDLSENAAGGLAVVAVGDGEPSDAGVVDGDLGAMRHRDVALRVGFAQTAAGGVEHIELAEIRELTVAHARALQESRAVVDPVEPAVAVGVRHEP